MTNLIKKMRKWRIDIAYTKKTIWVQIFTDVNRKMIIDVVEQAFESFEPIIISQYVDTRYPFFGNEYSRIVDEINQKKIFQVSKAVDFTDFNEPIDTTGSYVLNIFGKPDFDRLEKILHFGVLNMANVIYGFKNFPENWQIELLRLNNSVSKWFQLKLETDSDEFVELVNKVGLLEVAIDGNMFFCTTRVRYLSKLLHIIKKLSDQNHHSLKVDIASIGDRTKLDM